MDHNFCLLETAKEEPELDYPISIRILPRRWRERKQEEYILQEMPLARKEVEHAGISGEVLILPFTYSKLMQYEQEEIVEILQRVSEKADASRLIVPDKLARYIQHENRMDGSLTCLFFVPDLIGWVRRQHDIKKKDLHIILIDDGSVKTGYVLSCMPEDLNHLSIITDRPEYYEEYADYMYHSLGLIVSSIHRPLEQQIEGNVIMDLAGCKNREFWNYPENSVYLQMGTDNSCIKQLLAKRKDVTCYNRFYLRKNKEDVDPRIFQSYLGGTDVNYINITKLEAMQRKADQLGVLFSGAGIRM